VARRDRERAQAEQGAVLWPDLRLAGLLKRAQTLLVEGYGPALAPFDVDGRELAVLALLATAGAQSQQEISRRLGIDRTTVVALIDAMQARGLVQRMPDPADRRRNLVQPTASGRAIHQDASPAVDVVEEAFLAPLSPADRDRLKDILRTLIHAASR
jgi:DNA-binding MarR family transcriptional regulator